MADAVQQIVLEYIAKTDKIQAELADLQKKMTEVDDTTKDAGKSLDDLGKKGGASMSSLKEIIKQVGLAVAAAFTAKKITDFLIGSVKIAQAGEAIRIAFAKLNDPNLLNNLRKSVNGVLTDVELMKIAIQANNFKIPLNDLGKMLEFAKIKAEETGQSVEALASTLVRSIGGNSTKALIQFGIGQDQIKKKIEETGSLYKAVTAIISETIEDAGDHIETAAEKTERLNAQFKNLREEIGTKLIPAVNTLLRGLNRTVDDLLGLFDATHKSNLELIEDALRLEKIYHDNAELIFSTESRAFNQFMKEVKGAGINTQAEIEAVARVNIEFAQKELDANSKLHNDFSISLTKAYRDVINQIKTYVKSQEKAADETEDTTDEVKFQRFEVTKLKDTIQTSTPAIDAFTDAYIKFISADPNNLVQSQTAIEALAKSLLEIEAIIARREGEPLIKTSDLVPSGEIMDEILEKDKEAFKQAEEFKRQQSLETMDTILSIQDTISSYTQAQTDYQLALLQDKNERGIISDKEYAEEKRKILINEATREKVAAIFQAIIQSAINIVKSLEYFNPLLTTLTIIASAVQLAAIVATPIPKFAGGVERVKGKHKGKDSVLSLLMPDEAVITAKQNMKNPGLAKAWNAGKLDDYILRVYAPKLMSKVENKSSNVDITPLMRMMHEDIQVSKENTRKIVKALNSNYNPYRNWN